ncbi:MAG TPA: lysophospholipid acyltransferase family protein [Gemmatimonadaceae bacterium]|nr:lysophospholipid acyltransferase family protein [Gemmatimonadaceae bacterium]
MRALLVGLTLLVFTPTCGAVVFLASLLGRPDVHGSVYDWMPRFWARMLLWAGGVRLHLHNPERIARRAARIYVANHVSWFDVFALLSVVPRNKWVAKAELLKIPIFGPAAQRAGTIFIERQNRKAAFAQYDTAAQIIRAGASVIVAPEGTRGDAYPLRPFKKGPFVLAIAAGVPIVPTIVYGTLDVHPKGTWRVTSGDVHVHFLEEVPTAGYTYEQRNELAWLVWERMADAMRSLHGVESAPVTERDAVTAAD